MSEITNENIKKLAKLARIEIKEEEIIPTKEKLQTILQFVETLNEIDTSNVAEMTNVNSKNLRFEKDIVEDGNIQEQVLFNAKNAKYGYFAVPKVIE